jgi:hypothetical protein
VKISGIYVLKDPTTGAVRYVGQTRDARRREWMHCSASNNRGGRRVNVWIRSLLKRGHRPVFVMVEETAELDRLEKEWVSRFKAAGCHRLNMTTGGEDTEFLRQAERSHVRRGSKSRLHEVKTELAKGVRWARSRGDNEVADRLQYSLDCVEETTKKLAKLLGSRSAANEVLNARFMALKSHGN